MPNLAASGNCRSMDENVRDATIIDPVAASVTVFN
jgi:hypothetical protein